MKPEQQKLALLEWAYPAPLFKWTVLDGKITCEARHDDGRVVPCQTPNLNSLDVLAEFEAKLTRNQWWEWTKIVQKILSGEDKNFSYGSYPIDVVIAFLSLKPSQRLEALVRALGLWREGNEQQLKQKLAIIGNFDKQNNHRPECQCPSCINTPPKD